VCVCVVCLCVNQHPEILSLLLQVKAHPCDKDYQHIEGMNGCSPVFVPSSYASTSPLGIVNMQTATRMIIPLSAQHGTYAQTMHRNGFVSMLGRPPFNYSTSSPMRKAGFLSTSSLLDAAGNTIFKQCRSVPQCFKDTFTHRGVDHTRHVFVEAGALSPNSKPFMREWHPSDATKCGIFGIWMSDESRMNGVNRMCEPTTPSSHYCCAVDVSVAPLFHLFHTHPEALDELEPVCNHPFGSPADNSYPLFSKARVLSIVKQIGRYVNALKMALLDASCSRCLGERCRQVSAKQLRDA